MSKTNVVSDLFTRLQTEGLNTLDAQVSRLPMDLRLKIQQIGNQEFSRRFENDRQALLNVLSA